MKLSMGLALALGVIVAPSAASATEDAAHRLHRHHPVQAAEPSARPAEHRAPGAEEPLFTPFRPGRGNTNGLSRDPEDCNTGCIGGDPG